MRVTKVMILLLAGGLCFLPSCIFVDFPWNMDLPGPAEFHKVIDFEPGGTIQLENAAGDVEIRGWDESRVEITAVQEEERSFGWSWSGRRNMRPEPRVEMDKDAQMLSIKTPGPGSGDEETLVHYVISVPRSVKLKDIQVGRGSVIIADLYGELKLSLKEGDLTIENYSGSFEAVVENGQVEAEVLDLRAGDMISIVCTRGDVELALEKNVGARIEAEAPLGTVGGSFNLKAGADGHTLSAVLGEGKATVNIKAADGDIRLETAK